MQLLLDTHTLMWYNEDDTNLSSNARSFINNRDNDVFVSVASFYEMAVKINIGKLQMNNPLKQFYWQTINAQIEILPVSESYLTNYIALPFFPEHKDPFDRLIIATAIAGNFTIVSIDKKFDLYKHLVNIVW